MCAADNFSLINQKIYLFHIHFKDFFRVNNLLLISSSFFILNVTPFFMFSIIYDKKWAIFYSLFLNLFLLLTNADVLLFPFAHFHPVPTLLLSCHHHTVVCIYKLANPFTDSLCLWFNLSSLICALKIISSSFIFSNLTTVCRAVIFFVFVPLWLT